MDPQLTKQLIRRRMILENALESLIKEELTTNIEVSLPLVKDIIPSNDIKNNFLEKIKKFESFSENQINFTHQIGVDKHCNNFDNSIKFNKSNIDKILKKTPQIKNKLEVEFTESLFTNNKQQDNFHKKIKQYESSFKKENTILNKNTLYDKEYPHKLNNSQKTFKIKCSSSKSDYNNWKVDKNWVFYRDYSHLNK